MTTIEMKDALPLTAEEVRRMNAYWRAANYLSVGQIYLYDNPLLREPLKLEHVKRRLLGHWGTTPGLNFIYVHLNRLIKKHDLERDLCLWSRARRPGCRGQHLSRRNLQRVLSQHLQDDAGLQEAVQTVLVSRRHSQPCLA